MQHKNNIQVNTPRVMFAATRSGSGKTTVDVWCAGSIKKQNIKVQAYKCGPDYIDPMFHRTVLGIDTGNLDTFFADADAIGRILARDTKDAELIVMEGVMGYYDGVGGTTTMASSYELSKVTKTPVVLIVDAKGASVTLAAIIRGIMEYKKDSRIVGVDIKPCITDVLQPDQACDRDGMWDSSAWISAGRCIICGTIQTPWTAATG